MDRTLSGVPGFWSLLPRMQWTRLWVMAQTCWWWTWWSSFPPRPGQQAVKRLPGVVERAVASGSVEVFLQVNVNRMAEELEAGIRPGVSGVVMPRLEWMAHVRQADAVLSRLEEQRGISVGSLQVVASLDTALGNHRAMDLIQASTKGLGRQPGARGTWRWTCGPVPMGSFTCCPI